MSLGNAPIEEAYREKMNFLAKQLDWFFNGSAKKEDRHTGFMLLVFPFGDRSGRANYISNANRADVVTLLKEQLAYFEGQPDIKGEA